jgi:hypothetical protein
MRIDIMIKNNQHIGRPDSSVWTMPYIADYVANLYKLLDRILIL